MLREFININHELVNSHVCIFVKNVKQQNTSQSNKNTTSFDDQVTVTSGQS